MKKIPGLLLFAVTIAGCGGNGSTPNTPSRANTVHITLKADSGRTISLGMRYDDQPTDLETRLAVTGTTNSEIDGLYNTGVVPMLHLRGFDTSSAVVWTEDAQLTGADGESITVDPN